MFMPAGHPVIHALAGEAQGIVNSNCQSAKIYSREYGNVDRKSGF